MRKLVVAFLLLGGLLVLFSQQTFLALSPLAQNPFFQPLEVHIKKAQPIRSDDTLIGAPLEALFDRGNRHSFVEEGGYTPFLNFGMLSFNQRSHFLSLYEAPFLLLSFQQARNYRYFFILLTALLGMYLLLGFLLQDRAARWAGALTYAFAAHSLVWLVGAHQLALAGALIPLLLYSAARFVRFPAPGMLLVFIWASWELILCHYPPSQLFAGYFLVFLFAVFYLWQWISEPRQRKQIWLAGGLLAVAAILVLVAAWFAWYPRARDILASSFAQRVFIDYSTTQLIDWTAWPMQWVLFQRHILPYSNICEMSFGTNLIAVAFTLLFFSQGQWVKKAWSRVRVQGAAAGMVWVGAGLSLLMQFLIYLPGGLGWLNPLPYSTSVNPQRIFVLFAFAPAVFMALAWEQIAQSSTKLRWNVLAVAALLLAVFFYANRKHHWLPGFWTESVVYGSLLVLGLCLWCLARAKRSPWAVPTALTLLALLLVQGFWAFEPRTRQVKFERKHPILQTLGQELEQDFFYSIFADGTLSWNTPGFFQIPSLNGYDIYSEEVQKWYAALDGVSDYPPGSGGVGFTFGAPRRVQNDNVFRLGKNLALLAHFNVRFVVSPALVEHPLLRLYQQEEGLYLYEFKNYQSRVQAPTIWERLALENLPQALVAYRSQALSLRYLIDQALVPSRLKSCQGWTWHATPLGEGEIRFAQSPLVDCLLFVAAKYQQNYQFFASGMAVRKFPVNGLFTGILVPAGSKAIKMDYIDGDWKEFSPRFWLGLTLLLLVLAGLKVANYNFWPPRDLS